MNAYLTWLADALRAAGLNVVEVSGWQTRARSTGGYSAMPLCVMWHHTASPASWDGARDANYCATGDPNAPLSNLYIQRNGTVWILAAGATNTNGKGNSIRFSRGTVPADGMNTRAIGVECGNNGVGERWPQAQVDAMFIVSNVCNARVGNQPEDMSTHNFYAPSRKIDPATDNIEGPWRPGVVNSSRSWNRADVQAECRRRASAQPIPQPPDDEDDEMRFIYAFKEYANTFSDTGVHLSAEAYTAMVNAGATVVVSELTYPMNQHLDSCLQRAGLTADYLVPK